MGLADCLERLGLDDVDLLLIHWPLPQREQYVSTWRTFEKLSAEGLTRSIGVSNFKADHLDRLAAETGTVAAGLPCSMTRTSTTSPGATGSQRRRSCFAGTCSSPPLRSPSRPPASGWRPPSTSSASSRMPTTSSRFAELENPGEENDSDLVGH